MDVLRTPDDRFSDIDFDFQPRYSQLPAGDGSTIRMHYIDEGPRDGTALICFHGQPSWSFLYRKMVKILSASGFRVIAPDLIGFGKSDKPTSTAEYSYERHVQWLQAWIAGLGISSANLFAQDWGGLLGMRLVAQAPDFYERVIVANTLLIDTELIPDDLSSQLKQAYAEIPLADATAQTVKEKFAVSDPLATLYWIKYATENPRFSIQEVFETITGESDSAALRGYSAPFPTREYMAGPMAFPSILPIFPEQVEERRKNDQVWKKLGEFNKPFLTAFSDCDPVTAGHDMRFREKVAGAADMPHRTIKGGKHFLQEDSAPELCQVIVEFFDMTSDTVKSV